MAQSQTVDDAKDEVLLRRLIRPEEERRRLHPTRVWVSGYRWFSSPNVLPIERYRNRPKGPGTA
jgi:non-ribosomal peptide synthetase component F